MCFQTLSSRPVPVPKITRSPRERQRNLWWIDEKWLWSCPDWIMKLSIDKDLFVSFCHVTESLSLPGTADRRWWSKRKEGQCGPSRHSSLKETTYFKGMAARFLSLTFSLLLSLSVKNENYKEDNNKNSKMSGQAEASPLLKAALGFVVKMCCLLQKHASPPAQNKWAVPDIFTSNCSSVCGESCSLSRQFRPVHLRDRRGAYPETGGRKQLWVGSQRNVKESREKTLFQ